MSNEPNDLRIGSFDEDSFVQLRLQGDPEKAERTLFRVLADIKMCSRCAADKCDKRYVRWSHALVLLAAIGGLLVGLEVLDWKEVLDIVIGKL